MAPRRFRAGDFHEDRLRARSSTVAVCVPVLNEAPTIGPILDVLVGMQRESLVDEVLVVDAGSTDGTPSVAAARGARTVDAAVLSRFGPIKGKGDGMWRGLAAVDSDITCFFDGDLAHFRRDYLVGLVGPLLDDPDIAFVKGSFRRRGSDGSPSVGTGGRVTEAMGKPLLAAFYPALDAFDQPLSGQFAGRTSLLRSLPVTTGYGVDIGLMIDVFAQVGMGAMAEVDIGDLFNDHQELARLELMSAEVLQAVGRRLKAEGRLRDDLATTYLLEGTSDTLDVGGTERPPLSELDLRGPPPT